MCFRHSIFQLYFVKTPLLLAVMCDLNGFHGFKMWVDWLLSSYYGLITCLCLHVLVWKSTWKDVFMKNVLLSVEYKIEIVRLLQHGVWTRQIHMNYFSPFTYLKTEFQLFYFMSWYCSLWFCMFFPSFSAVRNNAKYVVHFQN